MSKRRLGAVALCAVLLLGGFPALAASASWAEEPNSPVAPLVETEPGGDEAPDDDSAGGDANVDEDPQPSTGSSGEEGNPGSEAPETPAPGAGAAQLMQTEDEQEGPPLSYTLVAEFAMSPMSAVPGGQIRFSGKCLKDNFPGDPFLVGFTWKGDPPDPEFKKAFHLGRVAVNLDGTFDQLLTIPMSTEPGVYGISGPSCKLQDQAWLATSGEELGTFTVLQGETPGGGGDAHTDAPPAPVLAETGTGDALIPLSVSMLLLTLGAAVIYSRRSIVVRRTSRSA